MRTQISSLSTADAPAGYILQAGPPVSPPEGWYYLESVELPDWEVADMTSFLAREGGVTLTEFLSAPTDFLVHAVNSALARLRREADAAEKARRQGHA